jgi:hypothetical protein
LAQDEPSDRVRERGKPAIVKDPILVADLEALVEPTTQGDPESPLRWTCKSVRRLAEALQQQGHQVSRTLVAELLNATGYSLQGNRETKEGDSHLDRDAQFAHIDVQVATALADQQPVVSVDTKKTYAAGSGTNGTHAFASPWPSVAYSDRTFSAARGDICRASNPRAPGSGTLSCSINST